MPSIVPGFGYDIFISYRQKDNKHDGWVTEFVNQLKGELEATFKEDISIYFDENPHDGLLETHSVDKSLEAKLKCLIFIPVISQTYCDSKSFAWQHEFCAFNKLAKEDKFGRDIKLSSGNVASRILPIKIHDLDPEDKDLLENELGGVLRSIEFIFKSAGVNRPLNPSDNPDKNLNKTYYRDQINKVANAIKEIISALKKQNQQPEEASKEDFKVKPTNQKSIRTKIIIGSLILLAITVLGYFIVPKLFKPPEQLEKSIAVLPFINDSPSDSNTFFINGLMEEILIDLQAIKEFRVLGRTSSEQYRNNSTKSIPEIARELGVNYIVEGSGQKSGNTFRIRVQLIMAKGKETHIWAKPYEQEVHGIKDIFNIQIQIAQAIASELKAAITPEERNLIEKKPTENLEAYSCYLKGNEFYWQSNNPAALIKVIELYEKAVKLDPNFALAYAKLSMCHSRIYFSSTDRTKEHLTRSKSAIDSVFRIDHNLPEAHLALGAYYYNTAFDYPKALEQIAIAEKQLPNNSECAYWKGCIYRRSGSWNLAKESFLRAFELDPGSTVIANATGQTLSRMKDYPAAEFYLKKAILNNPLYYEPRTEYYMLYLRWKGDTVKAREILDEASKSVGPEGKIYIKYYKTQLEILNGNYQIALMHLHEFDNDPNYNPYISPTVSLLYAKTFKLLNQSEKAVFYFNSAIKPLKSSINRYPDIAWNYIGDLGIAYASLGMKSEAIAAGKRSVELCPISKDASFGARCIEQLARIYVMAGEYNLALEQIRWLLSNPSGLSVKLLLLDPDWKPLWNLPEFKKIISTTDSDAKHN